MLALFVAAACSSSATSQSTSSASSSASGSGATTGSGGEAAVTGAGGQSTGGHGPTGAGGSGGSSSTGGGPPQKIGACDSLAPAGTWEEITPPAVKDGLMNNMPADGSGTFAFAVDPVSSGTIYVGTVYQKMWKSIDCGSTWAPLGTGQHASSWDHAMNWTFEVDPQEPDVVYTNSGYGTMGSGLLKSKNAGVDWDIVWPPAAQPDLAAHFMYNFANVVRLDPANHKHLVLTFHEACIGMGNVATCIAESFDAGASWKLIPGDPSWNGNEGQLFYFLENSHTWLWASQTNGFFRSDDSGATWTVAVDANGKQFFPSHLQGAGLHRASTGVFYVAAADGLFRSVDGKTWTLQPNTNPIAGGLTSDGTTMFASRCFFEGFCQPSDQVFMSSPETDGMTWTLMPNGPKIGMGGEMHYDSGHHLLYASTFKKGFWRLVTM